MESVEEYVRAGVMIGAAVVSRTGVTVSATVMLLGRAGFIPGVVMAPDPVAFVFGTSSGLTQGPAFRVSTWVSRMSRTHMRVTSLVSWGKLGKPDLQGLY